MGVVDGGVAWVPTSSDAFQLSLAADPELVAAASAAEPAQPVAVREIRRAAHPR